MKGKTFKSIYQCSSSFRALCVCLLSTSQSEGGVLTPLVWGSTVLAYRLQLNRCQWRRLKGLGRGMLDVLFRDVDGLMCSVMSGPHWVWSEADSAVWLTCSCGCTRKVSSRFAEVIWALNGMMQRLRLNCKEVTMKESKIKMQMSQRTVAKCQCCTDCQCPLFGRSCMVLSLKIFHPYPSQNSLCHICSFRSKHFIYLYNIFLVNTDLKIWKTKLYL